MSLFSRFSLRYRDGTVFHLYYYSNSDGSNMCPVPTWTMSTIAKTMFDVPQTEESKATYEFNDDLDDVWVVYTIHYIQNNPDCTYLDWDAISQKWNETTGMGKETGVLKLRFSMLKQLYAEWKRFEREYPGPHHPTNDDEWWTTTCPPEFEKFRDRPMSPQMVQLLARVSPNFMG